MFDPKSLSTDDLEQLVTTAETAIARLRAIQVQAIGQLDHAQVAIADGSRTMVDWVSSRLDLRHDVARELVSASRTMPEALIEELADGVVSFDRAIAETRLHTTGATEETILRSRGLDLAGVRRLAARHTRICPRDEQNAFLAQQVMIQPSLAGGGWNLWATLEGYEGAIVEKALNARAEELGVDIPPGLRMALALTTICQDSLYAEAGTNGSGDPIVTITADATLLLATNGEAGAEVAAGPRIGAMALQELLCVGKAELNVTTDDGNLMGVGRTTTSLPPRLRRAIIARDGACVIDGCTSRYRLEIHHVIERSNGGTDDPANLATLCWAHHHVFVHRRGFTIDPESPPGRRRLNRPPPPST
ncbi:MAG: HNH endonuclease [Acidimicrobiia bacterium]